MNVRNFFQGRYFTTVDVEGGPLRLTIDRWSLEKLPLGGEKLVIWGKVKGANGVSERGLALNRSNGLELARIFGSDEPDAWVGEEIELFLDSGVQGPAGRRGGVRVRPVGEGGAARYEAARTPPEARP